jgi:adenine phosphoribosyltransferase
MTQVWRTEIGSQTVDLSLVPVGGGHAISLLMTIDLPVPVLARAGRDLAEAVRPLQPEVVVTNATLGIPLAVEVCHRLGLETCVVLQKTPKIHLGDAFAEEVRSVTTETPQRLLLDRARAPMLDGRRVLVVDDVAATGSSLAAALRLVRRVNGDVVGIGVLLTEGTGWQAALGSIPGFVAGPDGTWVPD